MSKFNNLYNKIVGVVEEQTSDINYSAPAAGRNASVNIASLTPQQQMSVSDALSKLFKSLPAVQMAQAGQNLGRKIAAAGNTALQVIGQMKVNEVVEVIKNILKAPIEAQKAALANLKQAGIETKQDLAEIIKNIAIQKGMSDAELQRIINQFEQSHQQFKQKYPNVKGNPMSADQAAAGYERPQPMSADRAAAGYEY